MPLTWGNPAMYPQLKIFCQVAPKYHRRRLYRNRKEQSLKNMHGRKTDEFQKAHGILDYSAYVIEHFPHMEFENNEFADRFAYTIDRAYERGTDLGLSDEEFRIEISNAFDEWLGRKKPDII